jgi:2-polyprenyl-3-methyl-5-hydroxy-6-metoxy-1,4-benzoquinol methylase
MAYLTEREYWEDKWKERFDIEIILNLKWLNGYLYRRVSEILRLSLSPSPKKTFLEVGCGGGRWLAYFKTTFGYEIYGIDYSMKGCELARKVANSAGISEKNIQCKDLLAFANEGREFDVVFSDGFLEHFENPAEVVGLIDCLVKPGGTLITIIPNLTGLHKLLIKYLGREKAIFSYHRAIRLQELYDIYLQLGYRRIKGRCIGSIISKVVKVPNMMGRVLNGLLIGFSYIGLSLESEKISSTYILLAKKPYTIAFTGDPHHNSL